jgi:hypothetical protein
MQTETVGAVPRLSCCLRAVARLEQGPEYSSGTDKTWVLATVRRNREMRARAVRLR